MKNTRKVKIGRVLIGGDGKIAVQSMTTAYTADVEKTVAQIHDLEKCG